MHINLYRSVVATNCQPFRCLAAQIIADPPLRCPPSSSLSYQMQFFVLTVSNKAWPVPLSVSSKSSKQNDMLRSQPKQTDPLNNCIESFGCFPASSLPPSYPPAYDNRFAMESQRPRGAPFTTSGQLWPTIQDSTPLQLQKMLSCNQPKKDTKYLNLVAFRSID